MIGFNELLNYEIFKELAADQLRAITPFCEMVQCAADEVIFVEGDPATHLFLVKCGSVVVQIQAAPEHKVNVYTAHEGLSLGWSALVPPYRMTATCIALEPSLLIRINGEALRHLCDKDSRLGYQIMRHVTLVIEQRLHDTRVELSNLIYWIRQ